MAELPVLKKCCFCVPLRYGLLAWGYIKLVTALAVLSFYILIVCELSYYIKRDASLITVISVVGVILAAEIITHIVFIIGAHMKNVRLITAYYYYAFFMWIVIIILTFVNIVFLIFSLFTYPHKQDVLFSLDVFSLFFSNVVQAFLVISLRSEIIKLRSNCPYRFVKNDNDPEGKIDSVKDDEGMSIDNGTVRIL